MSQQYSKRDAPTKVRLNTRPHYIALDLRYSSQITTGAPDSSHLHSTSFLDHTASHVEQDHAFNSSVEYDNFIMILKRAILDAN